MSTKPKKFMCKECLHETYTDADICASCEQEKTIIPIPKATYKCYLNGAIYGAGDLAYMHELFTDYVLTCKMYGRQECEFRIVKD